MSKLISSFAPASSLFITIAASVISLTSLLLPALNEKVSPSSTSIPNPCPRFCRLPFRPSQEKAGVLAVVPGLLVCVIGFLATTSWACRHLYPPPPPPPAPPPPPPPPPTPSQRNESNDPNNNVPPGRPGDGGDDDPEEEGSYDGEKSDNKDDYATAAAPAPEDPPPPPSGTDQDDDGDAHPPSDSGVLRLLFVYIAAFVFGLACGQRGISVPNVKSNDVSPAPDTGRPASATIRGLLERNVPARCESKASDVRRAPNTGRPASTTISGLLVPNVAVRSEFKADNIRRVPNAVRSASATIQGLLGRNVAASCDAPKPPSLILGLLRRAPHIPQLLMPVPPVAPVPGRSFFTRVWSRSFLVITVIPVFAFIGAVLWLLVPLDSGAARTVGQVALFELPPPPPLVKPSSAVGLPPSSPRATPRLRPPPSPTLGLDPPQTWMSPPRLSRRPPSKHEPLEVLLHRVMAQTRKNMHQIRTLERTIELISS
ncbi:hypothetical protein DFH06DRAFT_1300011 [Mycena polygramma]|nr:hypothetical protein DFH06DRAFT_1300011 [Mycena polygramma]